MFKFILTAALLLPLAYANVSPKSQNIIPVPDCFPCDDDKGGWPWLTLTKSENIIPVPDCFPCDDDKGGWPWLTLTKSENIIPVPDCFPCDDDKGGWPWLTGKRASAEITNLAPADLRRRSLLAVVKS